MVKLKIPDEALADEADARADMLNRVFAALADRTRRAVLRTLGDAGAAGCSVSALAAPHGMSLTGFMKHLRVLEEAGLVARTKEGRVVRCELCAQPMQEAAVWLSRYQHFWAERFDALGRYLHHRKEITPWTPPPPSDPACASAASSSTPPLKKSGTPGPTRRR